MPTPEQQQALDLLKTRGPLLARARGARDAATHAALSTRPSPEGKLEEAAALVAVIDSLSRDIERGYRYLDSTGLRTEADEALGESRESR